VLHLEIVSQRSRRALLVCSRLHGLQGVDAVDAAPGAVRLVHAHVHAERLADLVRESVRQ